MKVHVLFILLIAAMMAVSSNGGVITGEVWHVDEAIANNAIPVNVPATPADAIFAVPNGPISFSSFGTNYTLEQFLATGGANCIGAICNQLMDYSIPPDQFGTLIRMTGSVTVNNGDQFTVTHDDGLTLIINGMDLGFSPGPTSPTTSTQTWNGPSGTFGFELVYGECCGAPAVLQTSLPLQGVPEPGTVALIGAGLLGLGVIGRRRISI